MANPTTYFGWVMPTSTDLVTDLPADFNVFGQGVDTSMQYLLGGTTGQILSKTSGTNMAFTWINNDQGDITGVTAGNGISVTSPTGPVPTVAIDTAVTVDKTTAQTLTNKTLTSPALTTPTISTATTNGDILYGTGSGALSRLGIGSSAQVLTVASGIPSWATPSSGGMTLLSTTTLSGSSTTISSISTSYTNLVAVYYAVQTSSDDLELRVRVNSDTGSNYDSVGFGCVNTTFTTVLNNAATYWCVGKTSSDGGLAYQGNGTFTISNYSATTTRVLSAVNSMRKNSTADMVGLSFSGQYRGSAAITSLTFLISTGTFSGGTILLYGVK